MTNMTGSKLSIFSHPGKITGYWITNVKCNKTIRALHFVQYDVLWSTEKQY